MIIDDAEYRRIIMYPTSKEAWGRTFKLMRLDLKATVELAKNWNKKSVYISPFKEGEYK